MELSIVLLSLSLSPRREEKDRFCAEKFWLATLVDAFEFSLCESLGLSATIGVIDIRGVLVKAGDVKLRLCCFWSSDVETWSRFFLLFFSRFILISGSNASFSLLYSKGLITIFMGDWFSVVAFWTGNSSLMGFWSSIIGSGMTRGASTVIGLGEVGEVMMAPSLL